jgi:hypothetical protein
MTLRLLTGFIISFALSSMAGAQSPLEKLRLTSSASAAPRRRFGFPMKREFSANTALTLSFSMSAAAVAPPRLCNRGRCLSACSPAAPLSTLISRAAIW